MQGSSDAKWLFITNWWIFLKIALNFTEIKEIVSKSGTWKVKKLTRPSSKTGVFAKDT